MCLARYSRPSVARSQCSKSQWQFEICETLLEISKISLRLKTDQHFVRKPAPGGGGGGRQNPVGSLKSFMIGTAMARKIRRCGCALTYVFHSRMEVYRPSIPSVTKRNGVIRGVSSQIRVRVVNSTQAFALKEEITSLRKLEGSWRANASWNPSITVSMRAYFLLVSALPALVRRRLYSLSIRLNPTTENTFWTSSAWVWNSVTWSGNAMLNVTTFSKIFNLGWNPALMASIRTNSRFRELGIWCCLRALIDSKSSVTTSIARTISSWDCIKIISQI